MVSPIAVIGLPLVVFVPIFYIEEIGLSPTAVGLIFFLGRIWDIVTDPPMGLMLDRFQSPWGKHKHWILAAVPLMAIGGGAVFLPPADAGEIWLAAALLTLYTSYTLLFMSQLSWGSELAPTYDERIRLFSAREIVSICSMVTVLLIPTIITWAGGDERLKFASIGYYMLILLAPAMLWGLFVLPDKRSTHVSGMPLGEGLKLLSKNLNLRRVLTSGFCSSITQGVQGTLFFLLCTHIFDAREHRFSILLGYFLCGVAGIRFWVWLAEHWQKHTALLTAGITISLGWLMLPIAAWINSLELFVFIVCFAGLASAAPPLLIRSLMSDVIDDDELKSGRRRSGLLFALVTTCDKIGFGVSPLVLVLLEWVFDYNATLEVQSDWTRFGILLIYMTVPAFAYLVLVWQMRRYTLSRERHQEIQHQLTANGQNSG